MDRYAQRDYGGVTPDAITSIMQQLRLGYVDQWCDLTSFMVRTDPHLRSVYYTRRIGVASVPWRVEPGGDNPSGADEIAAQLCRSALERIEDLERFFLNALDAIGRSYSVHEVMWGYDGRVWWPREFSWIAPRRFRFDEQWRLRLWDSGACPGPDGWGEPLIEGKFVIHVPRTIAEYPTLCGEFMSVVWSWIFKRWATKFWLSGAERFANPLMIGVVPLNTPANIKTALAEALRNISADSVGVVEEGAMVDVKHAGTAPKDIWMALIDYVNAEMTKGILGSTDNVEASHGSNARAESQAAVTILPRAQMDARALSGTIERDVFRPLLRYNAHLFGGTMPATPHLLFEPELERTESIPEYMLRGKLVTRNEVRGREGLEPMSAERGGEELLDIDGAASAYGGGAFEATEPERPLAPSQTRSRPLPSATLERRSPVAISSLSPTSPLVRALNSR